MPIHTGCITLTLTESYTKESSTGQGSYGRAEQDMAGKGMARCGVAGHGTAWQNRGEYKGRAGPINM
jgi:hypothetical protein